MTVAAVCHNGGTAEAADPDALWFEDFRDGQVFELGAHRISREEIESFARRYDPQPFHTDEHAALATPLKGLAASGWHTSALLMRLLSDRVLGRAHYAGLMGVEEIRWLLPVRPGDVLIGRAICLGPRIAAPGRGVGVVDVRCEVYNRDGQRVLWWLGHAAFRRRRKADPCAAAPAEAAPGRSIPRTPGPHSIKFFEDVAIGDEIALGSARFTAEDIASFCRQFDPRSAHPTAAMRSDCASGWHVASVWMQKLVHYYSGEAGTLRASGRPVPALGPSPGIRRLTWWRPVHSGDELAFTTWAERKLELPAPSGWGLVVGGAEARNQRGEIVISFSANLLLERSEWTVRSVPDRS